MFRSLRNKLFSTAAALSLLLGIIVAILWMRSYWEPDKIYRSQWVRNGSEIQESAWWLEAGSGRVGVRHRWQRGTTKDRIDPFLQHRLDHPEFLWGIPLSVAGLFPPAIGNSLMNRIGFGYQYFPAPPHITAAGAQEAEWRIIFPFWAVFALTMIIPAIWAGRWQVIRRRSSEGFCQTCGYDLRASRNRCPECGSVIG